MIYRIGWFTLFIWTVAGCGGLGTNERPALPPTVVTVTRVKLAKVADFVDFTGHTEAKEAVEIKARVTGYLLSVGFEEGKLVKAGEVLYRIDDRTYKAELAKAQGDVTRNQALLDRLKSDLERARRMRIGEAISREEFDKIAGNVDEISAALLSAKAAAARSQLDVDFTIVKAPISGRISRTLITVGNLVTADKTTLTNIVSIDPIYATFDVDERTVLRIQAMIRAGKFKSAREAKVPVLLGTQVEKGYPHQGFINFVDNRINPSTGTLRVRGEFPNKDAVLSPGLFVRIRLPLSQGQEAVVIPESAIGSDQSLRYVYVVGEDNRVVQRPITVGPLRDG
ncbi:MAG: efflux RND transporter periplasmic adaptor subunit, partial [Gemmataceae bacterium]